MLKFLLNTFYYKNLIYATYATRDDVLDKLSILFAEKKSIFKNPNLIGEFVNFPDGFKMRPKWSLGVYSGFEQSSAYLKGNVSETINNKTEISVKVRPNSTLGVLFIIFIGFGIYNILSFIISKELQPILSLSSRSTQHAKEKFHLQYLLDTNYDVPAQQ